MVSLWRSPTDGLEGEGQGPCVNGWVGVCLWVWVGGCVGVQSCSVREPLPFPLLATQLQSAPKSLE